MFKNQNIPDKIGLTIIGIVFSVYLWVVFKFTSHMPIMDDYGAVLTFLNHYVVADFFEKLQLLFSQHGEHRIVFNRIVELLQYKIFGEVNFLYLVIVGNLGWIFTIYLLWKYSAQYKTITIITFVPVVFIMLTFSHAALMTWAMASLQQYWQALFSLLAIFFLVEKKYYKAWIFVIISIFTGGGGFALIPIFLLYYLVHMNWKLFVSTLMVSIAIMLFYFLFLTFQTTPRDPSLFTVIMENPEALSLYILIFLGNLGKTVEISLYIGVGLIVLFLFNIKSFFTKVPFIAWSILFVLVIAGLTGLSRIIFGMEQALSSRYAIYSVLLMSLIYLGYVTIYKNNKKIVSLGILVGFSSFIYYFIITLPVFELRKYDAETKLAFPAFNHAYNILKKSEDLNIFKAWSSVKPPYTFLNVPKLDGSNQFCIGVFKQIKVCDGKVTKYHNDESTELQTTLFEKDKIVRIDGWTIDSINKDKAFGISVLIGDKREFIYLSKRKPSEYPLNNFKYAYSNVDTYMRIAEWKNKSNILEIRTLNNVGTGYYETLKVPVNILSMEDINKLPIVNNVLTGHTDSCRVKGEKLTVKGWYINQNNDMVRNSVLIDIDGTKYLAKDGISRVDVAYALNNNRYKDSGFKFELESATIPKGKHMVRVFVLSNDRSVLYDTNAKFEIEIK